MDVTIFGRKDGNKTCFCMRKVIQRRKKILGVHLMKYITSISFCLVLNMYNSVKFELYFMVLKYKVSEIYSNMENFSKM